MNENLKRFFLTVIALLLSTGATTARATVPQTINYQGYLTNTSGTPTSGEVSMTFRLYALATGGGGQTVVWTETQPVSVSNGIYHVVLGSVTPIVLPFNEQYWIGIQISPDAEMTPRQPLTSVPYAMNSGRAEDVDFGYAGSSSKGGPASLALALNADGSDCPAGQYARGVDAAGNGQGCTTEADPQVGTLTSGKWCTSDGTAVNCTAAAPVLTEADPTVNALGKATLSCSNGSIPKFSGGVWGCAVDGGAGNWVVSGSNMYSGVSGNIGIGTTTPAQKLDVAGSFLKVAGGGNEQAYLGGDGTGGDVQIGSMDATVKALAAFNAASATYMDFYAAKTSATDSTPSNDDPALDAVHAVTDFYGIGVRGKGGWKGVEGLVQASGTAAYHGIVGSASTTSGSGTTYGGYFSASGGTNNFGIYASGDKNYFSGNVGIGTSNPSQKLDVAGSYLKVSGTGSEQAYLGGDGYGADVEIGSMNSTVTNVAVYNHGSDKYMNIYAASLHLMGGADLAEPFNLSGKKSVLPGMLMAIDAEHPGELRIADKAYDKTVAGIVSGANGVKPGLMMQQEGTAAAGTVPVALTGRVYAWADASLGPIQPGDLLTTSDTPGHAMKATDHTKAQGAIIGKSMSALAAGTGMILVLVSLQ